MPMGQEDGINVDIMSRHKLFKPIKPFWETFPSVYEDAVPPCADNISVGAYQDVQSTARFMRASFYCLYPVAKTSCQC